jgi:hypothetical protein
MACGTFYFTLDCISAYFRDYVRLGIGLILRLIPVADEPKNQVKRCSLKQLKLATDRLTFLIYDLSNRPNIRVFVTQQNDRIKASHKLHLNNGCIAVRCKICNSFVTGYWC